MLVTTYCGLLTKVGLIITLAIGLFGVAQAAMPAGSKQSTACYFSQQDGLLFKVWVVNPYSDLPYINKEELDHLQACKTSVPLSAKGTKLDFRIVLAPKSKSPKTIKISPSAFRAAQGSDTLPVQAFHVQNWYQAFGGWRGIGRPAVMPNRSIYIPELLVRDDTLISPQTNSARNSIKLTDETGTRFFTPTEHANNTPRKNYRATELPIVDAEKLQPMHLMDEGFRQIWVTTELPTTTIHGAYKSEITFTNDNSKRQVVSLTLEVAPITLKTTEKIYSVYYKGRLEKSLSNWVSSDFKGPEQLLAELKDMRAHGITNPVIYQPLENTALLEQYLALRKQAGYSNETLYLIYLNTSKTTLESGTMALRYNLDKVRRVATPFGANNIYLYGEDEATAQQLLAQESAWTIASTQGFNIFAAGSDYPNPARAPGLKIFNSARSPNPAKAKALKQQGIKMLNYANPQGGAESPFVYRRNYGVVLWAAEYDGAMIYAYQDSMGDGWNDFDHSYRDHNLTYPSARGPISTIAWQGLAAAIEDMRYLETLESIVKSTLKTRPNHSAAQKASEYLAKLRSDILPYLAHDEPTREFYMDHQAMRDKIIELIRNISNAPVPPVNLDIK